MTGKSSPLELNTCSLPAATVNHDKSANYISKCQKTTRKRLRILRRAKGHKSYKTKLRHYLSSNDAKISASYNAIRARYPKRKIAINRVISVANSITCHAPISEQVTLFDLPKASGGYRTVCDFGWVWRATAYMLKPVLEMQYDEQRKSFQHYFRGYRSAVRLARKLVMDGHNYVCHLDIENCYPSFNVNEFCENLSLPKAVTKSVCSLKQAHALYREGGEHTKGDLPSEQIRLSLPQGLPVSPLVAEIIISGLKWKNTSSVKVVNFADNFLIVGKSFEKVSEAAKILSTAVAELAGGSFRLKPAPVIHACEGFEFLGHDFQLVGKEILLGPTRRAVDEATRIMESYLATLDHLRGHDLPAKTLKEALAVYGKAKAFLSSWMAAFDECEQIGEWGKALNTHLANLQSFWGISDEGILNHYDVDAEFTWFSYAG